jgi:hypothetical protein
MVVLGHRHLITSPLELLHIRLLGVRGKDVGH